MHGGTAMATAREHGWDWREILEFSASINPLGPSPRVRDAIAKAIDQIVHYPDPYASRLTAALAQRWNVDPSRILCGNGATDLIHFLARTWPHQHVTLAVPTFSEFHRAYPNAEHTGIHDQWPDTGLLVIVNPNNPTGEAVTLRRRTGFTLVDESFLDFTDLPTAMNSDSVLVLRSLTKFHALPGLRVGALVGPPDLIHMLRHFREPWQVNVLAEAAALAALGDEEHATQTRRYLLRERERLWPLLQELPGVLPFPTVANYFFAHVRYPADRLCQYLLERRILIRNCTGAPGVAGEAVRLAIRNAGENDRLLAAWREFQYR